MRRITLSLISLLITASVISLYAATGTPSSLVVRTDANSSLVVTAVTQVNPVTSGVFSSRVLRTDSSGNLQVILSGTVTPTYPLAIPASTCAAPSLGMSGGTTTGIAFTATPSILNCIEGTARTTLTATTFTSTVPILAPDGTVANPAYATANRPGQGFYHPSAGSGEWRFVDANAELVAFGSTGGSGFIQALGTNGVVFFGAESTIARSAANLLNSNSSFQITRGTITTDLPVRTDTVTWNNAGVTFTGWKLNVTDTASNAASLLTDLQVGGVSQFNITKAGILTTVGRIIAGNGIFQGNELTENSGGTAALIMIGRNVSNQIEFWNNSTHRWDINTSGHLVPFAGATYNIGANTLGLNNLYYTETTAPAAPSANNVVIYAVDNGGKTELCARFATGGACIQLAIEP